jgi:hypothetical protein
MKDISARDFAEQLLGFEAVTKGSVQDQ